MSAEDMRQIAERFGHESGFVLPPDPASGADYRFRFFVPRHEMEMCGHATNIGQIDIHQDYVWLAVGGQNCMHVVPELLTDDPRVFRRVPQFLVTQLTQVGSVGWRVSCRSGSCRSACPVMGIPTATICGSAATR